MADSVDERRDNKRLNIVIHVEYHMSSNQKWMDGASGNVSTGGMCLLTKTYISPGSNLDLIFYIPETSKVIEVSGEILWNEYSVEKGYYCNGIKFLNIRDADKDLISKFIENAAINIHDKDIIGV